MDHKEMSKKGGMAKSKAKTIAARSNARKPRKNKTMPDIDEKILLKLAFLELEAIYKTIGNENAKSDGLRINGYPLTDVIASKIGVHAR